MNAYRRIIFGILILMAAIVIFLVGYALAPRSTTPPASPAAGTATTTAPLAVPSDKLFTDITIRESASSSPTVTIDYPQFTYIPAEFNAEIASSTQSRLVEFRAEVAENDKARRATSPAGSASIPLSSYSFLATWEPVTISADEVSFVQRYDSYVGGANESQEIQTFNYDIADKRPIRLADLFPNVPTYLRQISTIARVQLLAHFKEAAPGYDQTDMLNEGTSPLEENFEDFTFTDKVVTIYFPKYAVAPGAFGEQKVTIERSAIK